MNMSGQDFNRNSLDSTLARVETKLDDALARQAIHEREIEELKKWRWFSAGIGAALGFIADKLVGK